MHNKVTDFPQYRMISGRKVYYKITSDLHFVELSWIGEKKLVFEVNALQYPEKLKIMDMLSCLPPYEVLPNELIAFFD